MNSFLHFDLSQIILTFGLWGLIAVVFAESGLFFGFFLPGDSLLFTAGLLATQGYFNIWLLAIFIPVAAILGDSAGYWFGARVGPALFTRNDSFFFKKRYVERTHEFYLKYGPRAVVIARFVPVVRTFAPILAGVGQMPYKKFLTYNIAGGLFWSWLALFLGYFLGSAVPQSKNYLLPITAAIIIVSLAPVLAEVLKNSRRTR